MPDAALICKFAGAAILVVGIVPAGEAAWPPPPVYSSKAELFAAVQSGDIENYLTTEQHHDQMLWASVKQILEADYGLPKASAGKSTMCENGDDPGVVIHTYKAKMLSSPSEQKMVTNLYGQQKQYCDREGAVGAQFMAAFDRFLADFSAVVDTKASRIHQIQADQAQAAADLKRLAGERAQQEAVERAAQQQAARERTADDARKTAQMEAERAEQRRLLAEERRREDEERAAKDNKRNQIYQECLKSDARLLYDAEQKIQYALGLLKQVENVAANTHTDQSAYFKQTYAALNSEMAEYKRLGGTENSYYKVQVGPDPCATRTNG